SGQAVGPGLGRSLPVGTGQYSYSLQERMYGDDLLAPPGRSGADAAGSTITTTSEEGKSAVPYDRDPGSATAFFHCSPVDIGVVCHRRWIFCVRPGLVENRNQPAAVGRPSTRGHTSLTSSTRCLGTWKATEPLAQRAR